MHVCGITRLRAFSRMEAGNHIKYLAPSAGWQLRQSTRRDLQPGHGALHSKQRTQPSTVIISCSCAYTVASTARVMRLGDSSGQGPASGGSLFNRTAGGVGCHVRVPCVLDLPSPNSSATQQHPGRGSCKAGFPGIAPASLPVYLAIPPTGHLRLGGRPACVTGRQCLPLQVQGREPPPGRDRSGAPAHNSRGGKDCTQMPKAQPTRPWCVGRASSLNCNRCQLGMSRLSNAP